MRLKRIFIYLLIFSIINPLPFFDSFIDNSLIAKTKPKSASKSKSKTKPKTKPKSGKSLSKSSKSKKKSKKSKRKQVTKFVPRNPVFEVIGIDTLADGLYYKKMRIGGTKYPPVTVHVLEGDLNNPDVKLDILKANGNSTGLAKLHDIIAAHNERNGEYEVKAAVNGSYWMAYYNYPIGTTVIDGDVVELDDKWYTGLFDDNGQLYIEPFKTKATIKAGRNKYDIEHVNRRTESEGIVLYNKFGGNKIPYFINRPAAEVMAEIAEENRIDKQLVDTTFNEFTPDDDENDDEEIDTLEFQSELHKLERNSYLELHSVKYVMQHVDKPAINKDIRCIVSSVDSGVVAMPENGFVLTPGANSGIKLHEGDTTVIRFSTDIMPGVTFDNGVAGTPRLVNNGIPAKIAGPKYVRYSKKSKKKKKKGKKSTKGKKKGKKGKRKKGRKGKRGRYLRSSRFYHSFLPRTALGVSQDRKTVFLVSVPASNLDYMTYIMNALGAYTAVNLDGGGSTVMVVGDRNVVGRADYSRRISLGVGFSVRKNSGSNNHSGRNILR